ASDGEDVGYRAAHLRHPLDGEPGRSQRIQELADGEVGRADFGPDAMGCPRFKAALPPPVTGRDDDLARVGSVCESTGVAGVNADMREDPAGLQGRAECPAGGRVVID